MHLLLSLLLSLGIAIAAILSVQNATAVSLKFLLWNSVQMPVGILLALAMGIGVLGVAIATPLRSEQLPRSRRYSDFDESEFSDENLY